jgi:hypothetical protein
MDLGRKGHLVLISAALGLLLGPAGSTGQQQRAGRPPLPTLKTAHARPRASKPQAETPLHPFVAVTVWLPATLLR